LRLPTTSAAAMRSSWRLWRASSATIRGAELLRMESQIGTIEQGKFADVIAIEGNPLQDIRAMGRVVFVMKGGQVYKYPIIRNLTP